MSVAAGGLARFGLIALLTLALGALLLSPASPAGAQSGSGTVDYDTDGDNLIEVSTLAQLNAIRYDLVGNGTVNVGDQANYDIAFPNALASMGCAATCTGYELTTDLDFNTDTGSDSGGAAVIDADDDYYNLGSGWEPLGDSGPNPFRTTFDGNNYTISNLFINRTGNSDNYIGLFGQLGGGSVRRVHLVGANVTGNNDVGALVGHITLGTVSHSSSSGTVSGVGKVGGLVGTINSTRGTVQYSRSSAVVTATGISVGGLVGSSSGRVRASYATGAVTGLGDVGGLSGYSSTSFYAVYATGAVTATGVSNASAGGLVGGSEGGIYASYSTGAVTSASGHAGGLLKPSGSGASVGHSYWDVTTTGIADDNNADTGEGKTTSDLQSPTQTDGYAGIYANWNIDVDADSNVDDPWDFGTASEYPALKADSDGDGRATAYEFGRQGRSAPLVDYDDDNDGLIEVVDLDQLNAIRHDLDGNGDSTHADYTSAFLNAASGMGCAATCLGYELADDLDFDTNGSGTANSGDTYWNTGAGWTPIGDHPNGTGADGYTAAFEGNGHTIANLFINQPAVDRMGLFGTVGETGVLRNLAVVDADVTGKRMVGTLAGYVWGTVKLSYATGSVHAAISAAGGLVGVTKPTSLVSQSYAAVDASATLDEVKAQMQTVGTDVGGLVGQLQGRVEVSYATGSVSGQQRVGGLVGQFITGAVEASYSTGRVQGNDRQGGLVGNASHGRSAGTVTNSYWDTRTSGQTSSAGGTGKTTIELMTPTAYGSGSDIYANWNLDLDGDTNSDDDPWDFGTASEYPALKADWDGNSATAATAAEFGSQARTAPIFADGTSATVAVVESAPANQDIPGSPAARGPAAGDTLTYALSGTDAGHFDIDAGSGQLKTRGALERAVKTSYSVVVTATYGSGASDSITVTINVAVDYDTDSDGLIEVSSLDQLDAIRRDLDGDGGSTYASYARAFLDMAVGMGCPDTDLDADTSNCLGYELMRNLDFDTHGDDDAVTDADTWWNDGDGWYPLGGAVVRGAANPKYEAIFEGNGFTISNMLINLPNRQGVGLFGALDTDGVIRNLGLVNATVTAKSVVGPLAGLVAGTVESSYVTGSVTGSGNNVGGLVGSVPAGGRVLRSYTTASVSSSGTSVGGLAGFLGGTIKASYAAGNISGSGASVGGLVGEVNRGTVTASYARGEVQGANLVGGLVGRQRGSETVTNSYWDVTTSSIADDNDPETGVGKTTSELQAPTQTDGYAGIYANWNLDLDGDSNTDDDPWDFGTGSEYPALKVEWDGDNTPSAYEFGRQGRSAPAAPVQPPANAPPTFNAGYNASPNIAEGATAVGSYAATDPDSDSLTYAVTGTDAGEFAISGLGVLTLNNAANHETKEDYSISVTVHDGKNAAGSADTTVDITLAITVTVDDTLEPPTVPTSVGIVLAVNGLTVSWTAPVMPPTYPPLSDYDVQHRVRTSADGDSVTWGAWVAFAHVGTGTTAAITGLAAGSTYEVQVQAKNAEGSSPWTAAVNGVPAAPVGVNVDYDMDNDSFIEVRTLAQLNAIRWDLDADGAPVTANANDYALAFAGAVADMGCPDTDSDAATPNCLGYELEADLTFDENGDGQMTEAGDPTYWNGGLGWDPIGGNGSPFVAGKEFQGNGHTISNLFIDRPTENFVGLFGNLEGSISKVGLELVSVHGQDKVGALVGLNEGEVYWSYAAGILVQGRNRVGGLVGENGWRDGGSSNAGLIRGSYSTVNVIGNEEVGGLTGYNNRNSEVTASYAQGGSVSGSEKVGGLVGAAFRGSIQQSYAAAQIRGGKKRFHPLQGYNEGNTNNTPVTDSYGDHTIFGRLVTNFGKTTSELRTPAQTGGYAGIYANWNVDVDGDSNPDDPWDFGTSTEYPALKVDFNGDGAATVHEFGSQGRLPPVVQFSNEKPAFDDGQSTTRTIAENALAGAAVGAPVSATDPDKDRLTYRLVGTDGANFTIDETTGQIRVRTVLDYETTTSYTVIIETLDGEDDKGIPDSYFDAGVDDTITVTITVLNDAAETGSGSVDYDTDGNGLIEVDSLAKLNAMRWDMNGDGGFTHADYLTAFPTPEEGMGCPTVDHDLDGGAAGAAARVAAGGADGSYTAPQFTCKGYELTDDLTFDENTDGAITSADAAYWDGGEGWEPIGDDAKEDDAQRYNAVFEGGGHSISRLFINRPGSDYAGLFGAIGPHGSIRNVALLDADVTGRRSVGALAGMAYGITARVYATGSVSGSKAGGLAGELGGYVSTSYSNVAVSGSGNYVGGLVGLAQHAAVIKASYARGAVAGGSHDFVGALVGSNDGSITASYAVGLVSGTGGDRGGLVGANRRGTITDSYWDVTTTGIAGDSDAATGVGKTTSDLQTPTAYGSGSDIYANWNLNLDGDANTDDDPWDFGTTSEYPVLKVDFDNDKAPTFAEFGAQPRSALTPAQVTNGQPVFPAIIAAFTPAEGQTAAGTVPAATDPDNDSLTYEMMSGASDGDHALFNFNAGTRELTFKTAPDYEFPPLGKTTYTVKIRVRDSKNAVGTADTAWDTTATVTINLQKAVAGANGKPVFPVIDAFEPDENQTAVGTIPQATDPENDSLTYEMMSDAGDGDHALFTFVPGTRVLTFKAAPNYEATPTKTTYTVKIRVRDSLNAGGTADTGWDDTVTVTINLQNVNEAPTFGVVGPYTPDENQTAVGTIPVATDPDAGATLTYEMMMGAGDGDHALFTFVPGTRVLTFKTAPNFENPPLSKTTYTVKIRVRDSLNAGGTADTGWDDTVTVTINLQNVNEAPTFGVVGPYTPDENQTAVGTIPVATDPDAGATLTYEMMMGAGDGDHALFTFVPGTRVLTFKTAPNFENPPLSKTTYTVKIRVRDSLNAGGTADTGWDDTVTVTINLQNVNEAPTFGVVGPYTPDENQTAVGTIPVATDPDAGATLTYEMMMGAGDGDHALFTFVPGTRVLTFKTAPNFENPPLSKTTYTVKIRVRDSLNAGGTADTGWDDTVTVTINLQNVNEAPTFGVVGPYTPDENQTAVGTIPVATDPDAGATLTYEMMMGAGDGDHALFTFVPGTRVLTFKTAPNFENPPLSKTTYTVKIRVRDSLNAGGTADTGWDDTVTVTINLQNVNEAPTFGVVGPYTPDENQTAVGTIPVATDPDAGATLTYEMMMGAGDGDHALFTFVPGTRALTFKNAPNFEAKDSYTVSIQVRDSLNAAGVGDTAWDDTVVVTINLQDVNEEPEFMSPATTDVDGNPVPPAPIATDTRSFREDAAADAAIGAPVAATDPDTEVDPLDTLTYALAASGDHASFAIDTATGQLKTKAGVTYDYEAKDTYTVTVTVHDGKNAAAAVDAAVDATIDVTINVTDALERWTPPTNMHIDVVTLANRIRVTWTAPAAADNTGKPALTGYKVEWRQKYSANAAWAPDWVDFPRSGLGTTTDITTYTVNAADGTPTTHTVATGGGRIHEVRVCSLNEDGAKSADNPKAEQCGSWTGNALPAFTEGTEASRSVAENTAANTDIGLPVGAADSDAGDTLVYSMTQGTHSAKFTIDTATGQLKTKDPLDHETAGSYDVYVKVNDGNNGIDGIMVTITVTDVNEPPAFDDGAGPTTRSVSEGAAAGDAIGDPVEATDPDTKADPLDTLTYALDTTTGDHANFEIDTGTGQLKVKDALDYETKSSYTVTVQVRDSLSAAGVADTVWDDTIVVNISVGDVNEAPVFTAGAGPLNRSVAENAGANANVGLPVPATDVDDGDSVTLSMSGTGANLFSIDSNGQIKAKASLDYETAVSYAITVTATDTSSATDTILVNISVTDVDEPPTAPTGVEAGGIANGLRVTWTAPVMTNKPALEGYDVEYALRTAVAVGATPATWGAATTSAIGVVEAYEITGLTPDSTYRVRVRAENGEGKGTWSSYVNGVPNEPPLINAAPSFSDGASTTRSVAENTAAGTAIGNPLTATDADAGDTLVYAIDGATGDYAHFAIDTGTGQLKAKGALDYESGTTSYSITVTVSDGSGGADSIDVTITVTNVNEKPAFPAGAQTLTPNENQTAAGTVTAATDPEGDTLTYRMLPDTGDDDSFNFNAGTRTLTFKTAPDFEAKDTYTVSIQVKDSKNAAGAASLTWDATVVVTVDVQDVSERPSAPTGLGVLAAANGLRVSWTAPDMTGKPPVTGYKLHYSRRDFAAGPGQWGNWVDHAHAGTGTSTTITGLTAGDTYRVQVRAANDDGDGSWTSPDTGVPTAPPVSNAVPVFTDGASTTRSVAENTAAGTNIGLPIAATDADAGDTLVYAIDATTGDHGHFAIDWASGQLKTKSALDYESNNRYTVVVTVSDGNGGTDSITVTIDVTDVANETPGVVPPQANRAPAFDEGSSASRSVAENTASGQDIGLPLAATDPDSDSLSYALGGTDSGHFALSGNRLRTSGALDYEGKSSYLVTVTVSDGRGGTDTIAVTITVTNVDEAPTVTPTPVAPTGTLAFDKVGVARRTVDAYAPVGTAVGAPVTATVSAGMAGPFYSVYTRSSPFTVDRLTGQLRTARKLGPADEYTIQLLATDGKGRLDVIGVIITVTGGRANRDPVFREGASATRSVVAGSSRGVRVGRPVTATDPDGDALFYMVSGADSSHFSIGSGSGQIKVGRPLTKSSYSFEVVVGDLKGGVDVLDITITVTAVDAPPVATTPTPTPNRAPSFDEGAGASRSVAENTPAGRNIGLPLAATDPDSDSLTYALGGTDSGHFVLSGNRLRTSGALDYEGVKNSYAVTVTVSDGRGGTDTIDVTITVTNVNEAPVVAPPPANRAPSFDEGASASRSVAENTPAGTDIGLPLAATDPDGDSLTYALSGTDSGHFALSGNQLRTSGDYAGVKSSYSVTVYVSDGRGGTDSIDVTVTVINVDEAPVEPTPQANRAPSFDEGANTTRSVAENTEAGQDIGLPLAATDPDSDSLTYALSGADSGHFALSGNRLQTSGALDYEGQNSYSVTVNVSDGNGGSDTTAVTITVTNVNEPPGALPGLAVFEEVNGIRVSWSAPDMTGKPPITGYDVQYKLVTATDWNNHSHSGTGTTIQGLTAGSTYNVRVRAKNDEGHSVWASAQATPTAPTAPPVTPVPPDAITNLEVTPGWSKLGLTWNMPDMTGKPPITHYEVQYKLSIDKYWGDFPHDSTVRRVTIDFLGGGLSYDVRVRAVNSAGSSDWVSSSGTTK